MNENLLKICPHLRPILGENDRQTSIYSLVETLCYITIKMFSLEAHKRDEETTAITFSSSSMGGGRKIISRRKILKGCCANIFRVNSS